ncbi:MAG: hypothetical protein WKF37_00960 [Bryobacteraceae bacterium]
MGQLHLPLVPSTELLALPNPWDPAQNQPYVMHDMVLFNGRYYLYHGAAPAVLLFTPWKLITGYDLPENFAIALFSFCGFLFSSATVLRLLHRSGSSPGPILLSLILLSVGVCQAVPFLTSRVWVYEIAISGGYFCLAAATFFLTIGLTQPSQQSGGPHRLMLGLAMACRPHLGFAAAISMAILYLGSRDISLDPLPDSCPLSLFAAWPWRHTTMHVLAILSSLAYGIFWPARLTNSAFYSPGLTSCQGCITCFSALRI